MILTEQQRDEADCIVRQYNQLRDRVFIASYSGASSQDISALRASLVDLASRYHTLTGLDLGV